MKTPSQQLKESLEEFDKKFSRDNPVVLYETLKSSGYMRKYLSGDEVKQFITTHTIKLLQAEIERLEGMKKPEIVIEDCENCGEEGYGKAWFGRGAENDPHGFGDRYYPTGSAVFCKNCSDDFKIGKEWNGEEIWKRTSDNEIHNELRLNSIKKKVKENTGYNQALQDQISHLQEQIKE